MREAECLNLMVAPGTHRPGKYGSAKGFGGVIQIMVTRSCDKACYNCTQGSEFGGRTSFMPPELFEQAVRSLHGYRGIVGLFGGNPAISPHFAEYCETLRKFVPFEQRGIWSNNPITLDRAQLMARTFDPSVSNINVHLDRQAYELFKMGWPACHPVGLDQDSRHSPVFVAMKDVIADEARIWELISNCDVNQHWSALIGVFRGELRAWFCEVAGAQAMLHQDEPDYPDTGLDPIAEYAFTEPNEEVVELKKWWQMPMEAFRGQVRKHCFDCGVPLRGYGELSQAPDGADQISATHASIAKPKRKGRRVEVVNSLVQIGVGKLVMTTRYLQNASI